MKKTSNLSCSYIIFCVLLCSWGCSNAQSDSSSNLFSHQVKPIKNTLPTLDSLSYKKRMLKMANGDSSGKWKFNNHYSKTGALLPFNRIIAFYGNLYSTRMGILGELPKHQMIAKLKKEVAAWQQADPGTPVIPALHYIVTSAQASPGPTGLYRLRMPNSEIDKIIAIAEEVDGIVFLDLQVGLSTLKVELPILEKYLKNPKVHLGIDPEFSMKDGQRPGTFIGSFDADDVNYAASYLAALVNKYNLSPKVLVLHRFTQGMLKNTNKYKMLPEVQFVINMDGWGAPERKINSYRQFVFAEPVQFTGFKIFYKNDLKEPPHRLLTNKELLALKPVPLYIQYQ